MNPALKHEHLIIRAEVNNPFIDPVGASKWMTDLVEILKMKILMGPYSVYSDVEGNRGLTATCIIETSHIAMHIWDECEPAMVQLDVYTCSDLVKEDVINHLKEMDPVKIESKFVNRKFTLEFEE